ncbi:MAG TPA: 2-amino-4-hydroxy-6-hydroxymethyldihydropteridine diphosphokinase [Flavitalea sp.]|nr:2-amino-4-hydroxy-6-hydroxymethyldihydropteridine diphosphokinase [Flavitalea sp.]
MFKVYLLIGGNLGNREENLKTAVNLLQIEGGKVTGSSAIFETAAWGLTDQAPFLNRALLLETVHQPARLLEIILEVELKMGRVRGEKNGPRIIDIDILFFDDLIISEPHLTIPHPLIQDRRFALAPMKDLEPHLKHPVLMKTISELFDECPDKLEVHIYKS